MTPAIQKMTAAMLLPQAMAFETMTRAAALWTRGVSDAMRPMASSAEPVALPAAMPAQAMLAAPEPDAEAPASGPDADVAPVEVGDELPPILPSEAPVPAEETGGPVQDVATLVDEAGGTLDGEDRSPDDPRD